MALFRVALPGAAYATSIALAAALLAHVVAGNAEIQNAVVGVGEPPAASGAPLVLTITVDGPVGPLKLYCATTTDRVESNEVNVSAAEVVQFAHEVCSHVSPD